jgi:hypothetical protein
LHVQLSLDFNLRERKKSSCKIFLLRCSPYGNYFAAIFSTFSNDPHVDRRPTTTAKTFRFLQKRLEIPATTFTF